MKFVASTLLLAAVAVLPAAAPHVATSAAGRTVANVFHVRSKAGVQCATFVAGDVCADRGHWDVQIRSCEYSLDTIGPALREEAQLEPGAAGGATARALTVNADRAAPYAVVQGVLEAAHAAGFAKIDVGIGGSELEAPAEIRVALFRDAATRLVTRRVGTRLVKDATELRGALQGFARVARAGSLPRVVIDAAGDVPWAEAIAVVDASRESGFVDVDFASSEK